MNINLIGRKRCSQCNKLRDLSLFSINKRHSDGKTSDCRICHRTVSAKHYNSNRNEILARRDRISKREYNRRYYQEHKHDLISRASMYIINNPKTRLSNNIRRRLRLAIKRNWRTGSAVRDLGCSIDQLMAYLELKFRPGMSWDNYGKWHIDHVRPLSGFDLTDRIQLLQACHYTNLQPLWAEENARKSNKDLF